MIEQCLNKEIMNVGYCFSPACNIYTMPDCKNLQDCKEHVKKWSMEITCEHLGLACNAENMNNTETEKLFFNFLGETKMETNHWAMNKLLKMIRKMEEHVPCMFNIDEVMEKHPVCYEKPINAFLLQEATKYNRVIHLMISTLKYTRQNIQNCQPWNRIQDFAECIMNNQVHPRWSNAYYVSTKPLMPWMMELNERVCYIRNWIDNGMPKCVDMCMLINPRALMVCLKQDFARRKCTTIDKVKM